MKDPFYRQARYLLNANQLSQLPPDEGFEIAFAGRSNAGKSSAINTLTDQKNLARTSKTPGRTQHIVLFTLDDSRRLVDLPGYGYAKVPAAVQQHWQQVLSAYLSERRSLRGLVLVVDARRPLTDYDTQMLDWCQGAHMPAHLLLTKADKLSRNQATAALHKVRAYLSQQQGEYSAQLFSALKKSGLEEAYARLDAWLERGQNG